MARQPVRGSGSGSALALALALAGPPAAGAAPAELPPWEPAGAPAEAEAPGDAGAPEAGSAPVAAPRTETRGGETGDAKVGGEARSAGKSTGRLPEPSAQLPPPPSDPNDAPFMAPPNNQIRGTPPRTRPDIRRGWSARRRFALTIAPAYASIRKVQFQNRSGSARYHGAGFNLELDAQLHRWIWMRAQGTYSGHSVDEVRVTDDSDEVVQTAPRGTIHVMGFGAGPVFALDLGRFLPLIEVGLGGLRIASPIGEAKGQRGAACGDGGSCDVGLRCNAANICEPTIVPELYFGAAVDVLIRRHVSVGGQFRYYAFLPAWSTFPVYMLATVRVGVRF